MKNFVNIIIGFLGWIFITTNSFAASSGTLLLKSEYQMKDSKTGAELETFTVKRDSSNSDRTLNYSLTVKTQPNSIPLKLHTNFRGGYLSPVCVNSDIPHKDTYTSGVVVFSQLLTLIPLNKFYEKRAPFDFPFKNRVVVSQIFYSMKDLDNNHKNLTIRFRVEQSRILFPQFSYEGEIVCWISPDRSKDDADNDTYYLDKFEARYSNDSGKEFSYLVESTKD